MKLQINNTISSVVDPNGGLLCIMRTTGAINPAIYCTRVVKEKYVVHIYVSVIFDNNMCVCVYLQMG